MPWGRPDFFEVKPLEPVKSAWADWSVPATPDVPEWANDEGLKKRFGVEVAKGHPSAFAAAVAMLPDNTSGALWVSLNWINDPIVLAAHDLYLKTLQLDTPLLDKTQLGSKLLAIAEEKIPATGRFALAVEDRLGTFKLYAQIMGYMDTKNNFGPTFNQVTQINVKLVKTEKHEEQAKDSNKPVIEPVANPLPVKLKLVSAG